MITKEGSTEIVNFMTPEADILVIGLFLYFAEYRSDNNDKQRRLYQNCETYDNPVGSSCARVCLYWKYCENA